MALVSDLLSVVSGEQVVPLGIVVGISDRITCQRAAQQVARSVVGISFRSTAVRGLGQLPKLIILVTVVECKRVRTNGTIDFADIASSIIIIPVVQLGVCTIRGSVDKILDTVGLPVSNARTNIISAVLIHARNISPADPKQIVILKGEGAARTEQHTAQCTVVAIVGKRLMQCAV